MKRTLIAFLAFFIVCASDLMAQAPDPGNYSTEQYEVKATRGNKAAMRDGVKLSVDVFQPQADGRFPGILIITPYSNNPGFAARKVMHSAAQASHVILPVIPRR